MSEIQPAQPNTPPGYYFDRTTGLNRWWDGRAWGAAQVVLVKNSAATAALVFGIVGFVLMGIPFFIGWFLGGIPDVLAVIFGLMGLVKSGQLRCAGFGPALTGLILACVSLFSVLFGAGSIW